MKLKTILFLLAVFCFCASGWAQAPDAAQGTLLISTDADCSLSIDGGDPIQVSKDALSKVPIGPGDHILQATSKATSDVSWKHVVTVVAGQQKAVLIELKPAIAAQRDDTDGHGHNVSDDDYQCLDSKPGDCAEHELSNSRYQIRFWEETRGNFKTFKDAQHLRSKILYLTPEPSWNSTQTDKARFYNFLISVADCMDAELHIRPTRLTRKKTLFTQENVLLTYKGLVGNDSALKNVEHFLEWYSKGLRATASDKTDVDVDAFLRRAMFDGFKSGKNGQSKTDSIINADVEETLTSAYLFGVSAR